MDMPESCRRRFPGLFRIGLGIYTRGNRKLSIMQNKPHMNLNMLHFTTVCIRVQVLPDLGFRMGMRSRLWHNPKRLNR